MLTSHAGFMSLVNEQLARARTRRAKSVWMAGLGTVSRMHGGTGTR